jgi:hypothetical protein
MSSKKKDDETPLSAEQLLEARVDAMMDTRPDATPASPKVAETPTPEEAVDAPAAVAVDRVDKADTLPPLDIFADSKGAPAVPKDLLKAIKLSDAKSAASKAKPAPKAVAVDPTPDQPADQPGTTDPLIAVLTKPSSKAGADPTDPEAVPAELPQADEAESSQNDAMALDDSTSDAAIDDIVAQEGDEVLAAEDAGLAHAAQSSPEVETEATPSKTPGRKHHTFFWFLVILLVIVAAISATLLVDPNISMKSL